jgi:hypothetical protein
MEEARDTEEARRVIERLDRIEALDHARAPASALLVELRALVVEAEAWARREHVPALASDGREQTRAGEEVMSED